MPYSVSPSASSTASPSPSPIQSDRQFDVVLYGATGFVGQQTVAYFAGHAEVKASGLRWALAGRDAAKLERVRAATHGAERAGIVVASADDVSALNVLAESSKVVLSTAGPFALYGSALVAACVRHGTHYVDITGETPWVAGLIAKHHAQAASNGTRIIAFCGFDSVPSDLGTYMMVQAMRQRYGVACVDVKAAFSLKGGVNGGTLASLLNIMDTNRSLALSNVFLLNPANTQPADTAAHADPVKPVRDANFNAWLAPFFMSVINTRVVRRSAAILGSESGYAPDFHYQEYLRVGSGIAAATGAAALSAGTAMSQMALSVSPLRKLATAVMPKAGSGPSVSRMDGGSFRCELIAHSAGGQMLRGRVADRGDPGNRATTKMVCESALCLALEFDNLPQGENASGVLTPATALGDVLIKRLRSAGMTVAVD